MSEVCVLLAHGFEEVEAITVIDVLRRGGAKVITLGVEDLTVRGSHGIEVRADRLLDATALRVWDAVILPGGQPGSNTLRDHPKVQELLQMQHGASGRLAAICAAPIALGKAGFLRQRSATCYPGFEEQLTGARVVEERVVRDGPITTSRGPGTAMAFALALVEDLAGPAKAEQVRKQLLV